MCKDSRVSKYFGIVLVLKNQMNTNLANINPTQIFLSHLYNDTVEKYVCDYRSGLDW
jgi:hypothetical protein